MRTPQEIYNELVQATQTDSQLQDLTFEPSSWNKALFWAFALQLYTHELFWTLFKKEVTDLIADQKVHTIKWYENLAKGFQMGYDLDWIDERFKYAEVDEESQIIKHCAVVHVGNKLRFKVATTDALGNTQPCDASQIIALKSYLQETKDAGVFIFVTSGSGDLIKLSVDVYFDPLVLSSEGNLLGGEESIVADTIEQWITAINFNGRLIVPKFQDMIEAIEGVKFAVVNSVEVALPNQNNFTTLSSPIYVPDSGYFQLENLDLNFIADV